MQSTKRQKEILMLLSKNKFLHVNALSEKLFIGASSIRRDLAKLEKAGSIRRIRGGAMLISGLDREIPLHAREEINIEEKQVIAKLAVKLINDGDIIVMDSSTTVYQLTKFISPNQMVKVITNGAKTAIKLGENTIPVYSTGGQLREHSFSFVGSSAKSFLENFFGDILFFSCRYISDDFILFDSSEQEADLRKTMIKQCRTTVLLCDSSKFSNKSFCKICSLSDIDYLITEIKPTDDFISKAKELNCKVIWESNQLMRR